MGESRDEYSVKMKDKRAVCSRTEKWPCPVGAFFTDMGKRDDLKNQEFLVQKNLSKSVWSVTSIFSISGFNFIY